MWQALRVVSRPRGGFGRDLGALAFLALCALILHRDAILNGMVFFEFDTSQYYYPVTAWLDAALDRGRFPLWSPYIYGGFPLFADGEAGALYPPNLILLAFLPAAQAFIWMTILRSFMAAIFTYAFMRVVQPSRLGAVVGALVFTFGSFMVTQMHHANVVGSALWLPLVLLIAELALRGSGWRRVALVGLGGLSFAMQLLTIHVQPVLMTVLMLGFYLLFRASYGNGRPLYRRLGSSVLIGAGMLAGGLALAAIQMLPLYELAAHASRGGPPTYEFSTSFSPAMPSLITLLFPYFFQLKGTDYWTLWFRWETTVYVGIAPLVLAAIAIALLRTRQALFFGVIALVSLLLALGDYSPLKLYSLFWQIPGVSLVRAPGRFSLLFVFSVAILAGLGFGYAQARLSGGRRGQSARGLRVLIAGAAASAVLMIGGIVAAHAWLAANKPAALELITSQYLALRRQGGIRLSADSIYQALLSVFSIQNERTVITVALLCSTALLLGTWYWWRRGAMIWQGLLVAMVATDLLAFASVYHPQMSIAELSRPSPIAQYLSQHNGLHRGFTLQAAGVTLSNRYLPFGVSMFGGYSSLDAKRHSDLIKVVRQNTALLDLLNVRYVIVPKQEPPPGPAPKYRAVFEDSESIVYENSGYLPRAFVVMEARRADSQSAALQMLRDPQLDPRTTAVLEAGGDDEQEPAPATEADGNVAAAPGSGDEARRQATVTSYSSTEITIDASSSKPAYLVLSDSFYPGWRATVDGRPTTIYRADQLFRAIRLPAGKHTVAFRYEPVSFRTGGLISLGSLLLVTLLIAGGLVLERRRLSRQATPPQSKPNFELA